MSCACVRCNAEGPVGVRPFAEVVGVAVVGGGENAKTKVLYGEESPVCFNCFGKLVRALIRAENETRRLLNLKPAPERSEKK